MKLAFIANPEKYSVKKPFLEAVEWTERNGIHAYISHELDDLYNGSNRKTLHVTGDETEAIQVADYVVAIGGDGTMLHTARLIREHPRPVLGINSGRLGFMANTQQEELVTALEHLDSGEFRTDERFMLQARLPDGTHLYALNEFSFSKKDSTSMITVQAKYDDMFINTYWADGLIVASPTGSTAYNLSSGGPIVMPQTNVMVLTPINPHTLTTRPLVLPSDKSLTMEVEKQEHEVLFSYDSQNIEIQHYPFEVSIKRSDFSMEMIELPEQSYFDTLRNKLMWGMDFRKRY